MRMNVRQKHCVWYTSRWHGDGKKTGLNNNQNKEIQIFEKSTDFRFGKLIQF